MELTQVNNSQQANVNNLNFLRSEKVENTDINSIQNKNNIDKVEYSHSSKSSFSINVSNSINSISNIQIAKNEVSTALKIVNNFEKVVTSSTNSLDSVQPQIQNSINTFNSSTQGLSDRMNQIIDEKSSEESRVYFDGILGAKPISGQEIYEAISKQKQNLEQYNKMLNNQLNEVTNQAKEMFANEKAQIPSQEQFEQKVKFTVEQVSVEVQNQSGSMVQTQANAEPSTSKELLVAS